MTDRSIYETSNTQFSYDYSFFMVLILYYSKTLRRPKISPASGFRWGHVPSTALPTADLIARATEAADHSPILIFDSTAATTTATRTSVR